MVILSDLDHALLFDMPHELQDKITELLKILGLKIAEVVGILLPSGEYYLYHVSPYPNWKFAINTIQDHMWQDLVKLLSDCNYT